MSLNTANGILGVNVHIHRQTTQTWFHTHMMNAPPTRPRDGSKLRSITSCFGCPDPCRRSHAFVSKRKHTRSKTVETVLCGIVLKNDNKSPSRLLSIITISLFEAAVRVNVDLADITNRLTDQRHSSNSTLMHSGNSQWVLSQQNTLNGKNLLPNLRWVSHGSFCIEEPTLGVSSATRLPRCFWVPAFPESEFASLVCAKRLPSA